MTTRRRRGEDGISFEHRGPCSDPHRHRHCPGLWRGELTVGYTGDGKRQRRKVSGTTKAAVIDKLRDLRTQLDKGVTPKAGYAHYTVRQAAQDWLAHGLDGRGLIGQGGADERAEQLVQTRGYLGVPRAISRRTGPPHRRDQPAGEPRRR